MEFSRQVQVQEAAFRFGEGFFSTTRIKNYIPLWLSAHIQRLNNSMRDFHMPALNEEQLMQTGSNWPVENQLADGFMRILAWAENGVAHFNLEGGKLEAAPLEFNLTISKISRHSSEPLLKYKSMNYWTNNLIYREARQKGFDEAVLLNEKSEVAECSRNNLFWVKNDVLYTPQPGCGLLPGIARGLIKEIAGEQGIVLQEGNYSLIDLQNAEEVFLTNSLRGIRPVRTVDTQPYPPGRMTGFLQSLYRQREIQSSKA